MHHLTKFIYWSRNTIKYLVCYVITYSIFKASKILNHNAHNIKNKII